MKSFLFCIFFISCLQAFGQNIEGTVQDMNGEEFLSFVNVANQTTQSTALTDENGNFSIKAVVGRNDLEFSLLGFEAQKISINYPQDSVITIYLREKNLEINEVVVEGKSLNLGKLFIKKTIEAKKDRATDDSFSKKQYEQVNVFRTYDDKDEQDSVALIYLRELYFSDAFNQGKFKRTIHAEEESISDNSIMNTARMMFDRDFKGSNTTVRYNSINYFLDPRSTEIDLYENSLNNPSISERPITSPLSSFGAFTNYKFKLVQVEERAQDSLLTISVEPKLKQEPLWNGEIQIRTSDFAVENANLSLNQSISGQFKELRVQIGYQIQDGIWMLSDNKISYDINTNNKEYTVEITNIVESYDMDPDYSKKSFGREIIMYDEGALEKNADRMNEVRPFSLDEEFTYFVNRQDSIYEAHHGVEYLRKQDSIYNKITWRSVFLDGITHRKRSTGVDYYFGPLLQFVQVFGIGGFRFVPSGGFNKEFPNATKLDVDLRLNYGFANKDLKGRVKVGYMFWPERFGRFYGKFGDNYDLITTYQSLDLLLSGSNVIRNINFGGGYAMEVYNGVFITTDFTYSDKSSIEDLERNQFLDFIFGVENNTSIDFERYKSFIWSNDITIKFKQDYVMRGKKKIILPNKYPVLKIKYDKGFPTIFDSEVNYDYLEARLTYKLPSTKLGSLNSQLRVGGYVNSKSLRLAEYNFFRGSTPFIFTNPLEDFQYLGPTLSTSNTFFELSGIHHFGGFFFDKVPLINLLQMELLAGAGVLSIPSEDLFHTEVYAGIGKKFKLWGETVQIAAYYAVSNSTLSEFNSEVKFGLNFYNAFTKEWFY